MVLKNDRFIEPTTDGAGESVLAVNAGRNLCLRLADNVVSSSLHTASHRWAPVNLRLHDYSPCVPLFHSKKI